MDKLLSQLRSDRPQQQRKAFAALKSLDTRDEHVIEALPAILCRLVDLAEVAASQTHPFQAVESLLGTLTPRCCELLRQQDFFSRLADACLKSKAFWSSRTIDHGFLSHVGRLEACAAGAPLACAFIERLLGGSSTRLQVVAAMFASGEAAAELFDDCWRGPKEDRLAVSLRVLSWRLHDHWSRVLAEDVDGFDAAFAAPLATHLALVCACAHVELRGVASAAQAAALAAAEAELIAAMRANRDALSLGMLGTMDSQAVLWGFAALAGQAFLAVPVFSMQGAFLRGSTNAQTIVRALQHSEAGNRGADGKASCVRVLYWVLQQAGRHADTPHNIACAEGVGALLKAGLLKALKQRLLATYDAPPERYVETVHAVVGILTWLGQRYTAVVTALAAEDIALQRTWSVESDKLIKALAAAGAAPSSVPAAADAGPAPQLGREEAAMAAASAHTGVSPAQMTLLTMRLGCGEMSWKCMLDCAPAGQLDYSRACLLAAQMAEKNLPTQPLLRAAMHSSLVAGAPNPSLKAGSAVMAALSAAVSAPGASAQQQQTRVLVAQLLESVTSRVEVGWLQHAMKDMGGAATSHGITALMPQRRAPMQRG